MFKRSNKICLFSVIMPAFNAANTIEEAIESVQNQTSDEEIAWELIVVNDGSTDETLSILERYAKDDDRIKHFTQPNGGTGAALKRAAANAQGEYLVQLGADDLLEPNYMAETNRVMHEHPGLDIYSSNAEVLYSDGSTAPCFTGAHFDCEMSLSLRDMIKSNKIYGTAALNRTLYKKIGGFRPEFYNEDYDLWLRAFAAGAKHIYSPLCLAKYRVSPGQKTQSTLRVREGDIAILKSLRSEYSFGITDRICIDFEIKLLQLKIVIKKLLGMH